MAQCHEIKKNGEQCQRKALENQVFCAYHSLSPEERRAFASEGAKSAVLKRRAKAGPKSHGNKPYLPFDSLLKIIETADKHLSSSRPAVQAIGALILAEQFRLRNRAAVWEIVVLRAPHLEGAPPAVQDEITDLDAARRRLAAEAREAGLDARELPPSVAALL